MKWAIPLLLAAVASTALASTDRCVCYFGSWAVYRYGPAKYTIEDIANAPCTHVIYTFVGLDETQATVQLLDAWNDVGDEWKRGLITILNEEIKSKKNFTTSVAIGGWNEGSEKYSRAFSDDSKRKKFAQNAREFTIKYGFDGFDLDWEYPNQRGGVPADTANFCALIKEMREEFDKYGLRLTAAVSANAATNPTTYDIPCLNRYLHEINVMTYDLHGSWDPTTGHQAALTASEADIRLGEGHLCVEKAIEYWINAGADPSRINVGLATYGRTFTLASSDTGMRAPASGPGRAGKYVGEAGFLGYNEICYETRQNLWTVRYSSEHQAPYAWKGDQWCGYDDPQSIKLKVDFAKRLGCGGVMFWSIETDDFRGDCGEGKYPLISAAYSQLKSPGATPFPENPTTTDQAAVTEESTTEQPTTQEPEYPEETTSDEEPTTETPEWPEETTAPADTTTASSGNEAPECESAGQYWADRTDCNAYYMCAGAPDGQTFQGYRMRCPEGLRFNAGFNGCDYPYNVQCYVA